MEAVLKDIQALSTNLIAHNIDMSPLESLPRELKDKLQQKYDAEYKAIGNQTEFKKIKDIIKKPITEKFSNIQEKVKLLPDKDKVEIETGLSKLVDLTAKQKFFEFKYVQLSTFIIIFIDKVKTLLLDLVKTHKDHNEKETDNLKEIIKQLLAIMNSNIINITDDEIQSVETLLEEGITQKPNSSTDLTSETGLMEQLNTILKDAQKEALGTPAAPVVSGGFVKGHSVFPQSFYTL